MMAETEGTGHTLAKTKRRRILWSGRTRERFFDALARTCNVAKAAAEVHAYPAGAHRMRRMDADFAADWSRALAAGRESVEMRMIAYLLRDKAEPDRTDGRGRKDPDEILDAADFERALALLRVHAPGAVRKPGGRVLKRATQTETDAAIAARLDAVAKGLPLPSGTRARPVPGRRAGAKA